MTKADADGRGAGLAMLVVAGASDSCSVSGMILELQAREMAVFGELQFVTALYAIKCSCQSKQNGVYDGQEQ